MKAKGLKSVQQMVSSAGSKYEGDVKDERMDGQGKFTMANGNFYIGQMKDGQFHGNGVLYFPGLGRFHGRWDRSKVIKGKYVFEDGLVYDERRWEYCPERDRRFYTASAEYDQDEATFQDQLVTAAEADQECGTACAKPIEIPAGCYDVGDGYFDPSNKSVYTYDGEFIRHPTKDEIDWIVKSCAQNQTKVRFGK
eukprot:TRINITY_DN18469_c0_g1_i1.p1 TRINITY_DN18469_c0_g1~~TRINITY_DN18469_c0_g1_i1.p1  ORF type:complete len:195 (-),score=41.64 TRINITY_DN18469_c0_g1_i1:202-786(-)